MGSRKYRDLNVLVSKAMKNDRKAFDKLCEREASVIIYTCTKLMGNLHDGEDAAQEVFIELQKSITKLRAPEAYTSWVQGMISNVCNNMRRKNMNNNDSFPLEDFADLFTVDDSDFLPEEYLQNKEKGMELMEIINQLPHQTRGCITMHYFNEMKVAEIAAAMEIAPSTVRTHLYLGREKIRKAIKVEQSSALLPATALSSVFLMEMQELISPAVIESCLAGAGVGTAALPVKSFFQLPAVKNVMLAAACTAIAATSIAAYSHFTSNGRSADFSGQPAVPQQQPDHTAGGDEDMAAVEEAAATPEPSYPTRPPSREDSVASENLVNPINPENIESPPPLQEIITEPETPTAHPTQKPPSPALTPVTGRLSPANGAEAQNMFADWFYATIKQNGQQLALAMVADNGEFAFDNLYILSEGSYNLQLHCKHGDIMAFAGSSSANIPLVPGESFSLEQPFLVESTLVPDMAISILSQTESNTAADPAAIKIEANGIGEITYSWRIQNNEDESISLNGSSALIGSDIINALPEGTYTVRAEVKDAWGNENAMEKTFCMQ